MHPHIVYIERRAHINEKQLSMYGWISKKDF